MALEKETAQISLRRLNIDLFCAQCKGYISNQTVYYYSCIRVIQHDINPVYQPMRGYTDHDFRKTAGHLTIPQLINSLFILYWSCHGTLTQQTDCFICTYVRMNQVQLLYYQAGHLFWFCPRNDCNLKPLSHLVTVFPEARSRLEEKNTSKGVMKQKPKPK